MVPPPTDPPGPGSARGWWQCRALRPDGSPAWFAQVWSDRHAAGEGVELPEAEALEAVGQDAVCVATYDDQRRVVRLGVTPTGAAKAPPLWFVELDEPGAPPAGHLMGFTGHGLAPGTLVTADAAAGVVTSADQLGSVRWYVATGEVDQIYVAPAWRRRGVASALIAAMATLTAARGGPRMWSDGQRTEMGEQLRSASPWAYRTADLTHVAPPMTPGEPFSRPGRTTED